MIYPKFPKAGDTIGICAPSSGVGGKLDSYNMSIETLKEAGFNIKETASVRNDDSASASAEIRGAEFNEIYSDDDVSLVLCASGGNYCIEMLPYIDQEMIKANPKWFCGYSDPTNIEMLLTTKHDIATIYGVNGGAWDWRPLHEFQETALKIMQGDIPVQHSYEFYSPAIFENDKPVYDMTYPVKWELYKGESGILKEMDKLNVSGRLIGGCADIIFALFGTPYEDLIGFAERYKEDGFIWFFDNFALGPSDLMYLMIKMKLAGLFDNAAAIVIGRTFLPGDATDDDYLSALGRVFGEMDVPLIYNADIGHTKPSFTIVNGAVGCLKYADGKASLEMELR